MSNQPIISLQNIVRHFDVSGGFLNQLRFSKGKFSLKKSIVRAVNNASFDIQTGQTVSVVGESGCGKSTLGRTIMGLYRPTEGKIMFKGTEISALNTRQMLPYRAKMQMIFQDPYASLNPRMTVKQILEEPVRVHQPNLSSAEVLDKVAFVMSTVGVDPRWGGRFPHEFSGGQRQRISIARALMVDPEFIVADEPISALDVSIQAQILNLLLETQEKNNLTYLFVSHDLSVVEHISDQVIVMYLGSLCEIATAKDLFENPRHPYTQVLLNAIPRLGEKQDRTLKLLGEIPSPLDLPSGCVFHTRCIHVNERCRVEIPTLQTLSNGTKIACHAVEENRI